MSHVLALDQGTTSSRAILFDRDGRIVSVAQKEFQQIYPQPGWVEHDPGAIWSTQVGVLTEALGRANLGRRDVECVGITNQRETTVVWDRQTRQPIYNAIVWQDRRTAGLCDRLRDDGHEDVFRHKTGLVVDAYFSGTKIAWILDHVDGARQRAEDGKLAFGTIDTWLAWKLTHGRLHVTDPSNASRTLLFNIHDCDWDDDLLGILRIPRAMMPEVRPSSEVYGEISSSLAVDGAPLASLIGDQQAATMGQLRLEPGLAKNTYGTGCFLLMNTGPAPRESQHKLLSTIAWQRDGVTTYALEGGVFIGGAIVQWLRDGLRLIREASEVEALAARVADSGGVYFVPALAGLGAPYWDPYARGTIVGITRGTTDAHIARAALEGVAHEVADLVEAMEADAAGAMTELRVDGGAAANNLLMQFQADVLQKPVVRPHVLETTALGAAYLAGRATGFWKSDEDLQRNQRVDRQFEPQMSADHAMTLRTRWKEAVKRSRDWAPREEV